MRPRPPVLLEKCINRLKDHLCENVIIMSKSSSPEKEYIEINYFFSTIFILYKDCVFACLDVRYILAQTRLHHREITKFRILRGS